MNSIILNNPILVDIGNSALKYAVADSDTNELDVSHRLLQLDDEAIGQSTLGDLGDDQFNWWVSSVSEMKLQKLMAWIEEFRPLDQVYLISNTEVPLEVIPSPKESVGTDRLLAAVGCFELLEDGDDANLIVVDAGTAVTVDAIDSQRQFLVEQSGQAFGYNGRPFIITPMHFPTFPIMKMNCRKPLSGRILSKRYFAAPALVNLGQSWESCK